MMFIPPDLRLRIDVNLAEGSPLYVLALYGLSVVAALRELSWHFAVALGESFPDESEYAAALIEVLSPMALTTRLLPPGAPWNAHATLRLHTKTRVSEANETNDIVQIDFTVNDLEFSNEETLYRMPTSDRATLTKAYDEEMVIIRALDGFSGDAAALLERLRLHMECGAILAREQIVQGTARRAQMGLQGLYAEDPLVRERIDKFATWLIRLQSDEERFLKISQRC